MTENKNAQRGLGVEGAADFGLQANHSIAQDALRELAIEAEIQCMNEAHDPSIRRMHWERAKVLIGSRSPTQIKALERSRGLA